jgi:prevent-host-death family protein
MTRLLALGVALATTIAVSGRQQPASAPNELRGRVIDAITGAPVADASVYCYRNDSTGTPSSHTLHTDDSGAFVLLEVSGGEYRISASKPGYLRGKSARPVIMPERGRAGPMVRPGLPERAAGHAVVDTQGRRHRASRRRLLSASRRLTSARLSYKMSYMRKATVSVRELQQNLKQVIARVERGETVEVTRRRRPVARLAPVAPAGPMSAWPDLEARTRAVFGNRLVVPGGAEVVIDSRGDR